MNGVGVHIEGNGRKYIGEFLDDKKNGFGLYIWTDGKKYLGNWKDGKQHGPGKFSSEGRKPSNGFYQNGEKMKDLTSDEMVKYNDEGILTFADMFDSDSDSEKDNSVTIKSIENQIYTQGNQIGTASFHFDTEFDCKRQQKSISLSPQDFGVPADGKCSFKLTNNYIWSK